CRAMESARPASRITTPSTYSSTSITRFRLLVGAVEFRGGRPVNAASDGLDDPCRVWPCPALPGLRRDHFLGLLPRPPLGLDERLERERVGGGVLLEHVAHRVDDVEVADATGVERLDGLLV